MTISLYVHVPFCLKKCRYCDFVSYPYEYPLASSYLQGLEQEIIYYANMLPREKRHIKTLFIGGGTPTVLETNQLVRILDCLHQHFFLMPGAEITIEANPGTVNGEKLNSLRQWGVNRLSLGVQACQPHLLNLLGRIHDYNQAVESVTEARRAGFDNINMDLIFSIPGQSIEEWHRSLKLLTELQPNHLSCYSLQLEEGTPLTDEVHRGGLCQCPEELELEMYNHAMDFLNNQGYIHYEISNFCKPGHQSRHNLCYWQNHEYLGLGPGSHSYINDQRWANTGDVMEYGGKLVKGNPPITERLFLNQRDTMCETAFMGLRLIEGLDINEFYRRFGLGVTDVWSNEIDYLLKTGLVELTRDRLKLTRKGLPLANIVFAKFI